MIELERNKREGAIIMGGEISNDGSNFPQVKPLEAREQLQSTSEQSQEILDARALAIVSFLRNATIPVEGEGPTALTEYEINKIRYALGEAKTVQQEREKKISLVTESLEELSIDGEPIFFTPDEVKKITTASNLQNFSSDTLSERIISNFKENITNLGISPQEWKKVVGRYPDLLWLNPDTILSNISVTANLLAVEVEQYTRAAIKHPRLIGQSPESIQTNIHEAAKLLGADINTYTEAALKSPGVISIPPDAVFDNFEALRFYLFNGDQQTALEAALKNLSILATSQERTFLHFLAREIVGKKTSPVASPQKIIEREYQKGNLPGVTDEGLRLLLSALDKFSDDGKSERREARKKARGNRE